MADSPTPRLDSLVLEALLCLVPIPGILSMHFKDIVITNRGGSHPIGAQLNGIAVVGYAESGMFDSSTDVTIILYDQEVRHGVVRQALLSGCEQEPRFGRTIGDRQQL